MTMRARPTIPLGHGEVVTRPEVSTWPHVAARNARFEGPADLKIGGLTWLELKALARDEAVQCARDYSARLGVELVADVREPDLVLLTGHQPELFHPGVWVKHFLLDDVCVRTGAVGIDLVVDTDLHKGISLSAPCLTPEVRRCSCDLATGDGTQTYQGSRTPSIDEVESFCQQGTEILSALPAAAPDRHFGLFCDSLRGAHDAAENLGDLVTIARRRFEASAGTRYLELPVSRLARAESYLRFAAHLIMGAEKFRIEHNAELAEYRLISGTRSAVQPFPDLGATDERVEIPFWLVDGSSREALWVRVTDGTITLLTENRTVLEAPAEVESLVSALEDVCALAPRALTLTMFARLFVGDLFIHGVGGGRYDRVTDGVIRRVFRTEPPEYAVASMTMFLPVGGHVVSEQDVAEARQRVHRFEHNPDTMLDETECTSEVERRAALELVEKKRELVEAIARDGADKKALGADIREVNERLGELLAPRAEQLRRELVQLEHEFSASNVLTDRTYPFCLWSPVEVQDKVR